MSHHDSSWQLQQKIIHSSIISHGHCSRAGQGFSYQASCIWANLQGEFHIQVDCVGYFKTKYTQKVNFVFAIMGCRLRNILVFVEKKNHVIYIKCKEQSKFWLLNILNESLSSSFRLGLWSLILILNLTSCQQPTQKM